MLFFDACHFVASFVVSVSSRLVGFFGPSARYGGFDRHQNRSPTPRPGPPQISRPRTKRVLWRAFQEGWIEVVGLCSDKPALSPVSCIVCVCVCVRARARAEILTFATSFVTKRDWGATPAVTINQFHVTTAATTILGAGINARSFWTWTSTTTKIMHSSTSRRTSERDA